MRPRMSPAISCPKGTPEQPIWPPPANMILTTNNPPLIRKQKPAENWPIWVKLVGLADGNSPVSAAVYLVSRYSNPLPTIGAIITPFIVAMKNIGTK